MAIPCATTDMVVSESRKPIQEISPLEEDKDLIPWYVVGATALICAAALILISVLGPLVLGTIHYRTTQSGIWQTEGQDFTGSSSDYSNSYHRRNPSTI